MQGRVIFADQMVLTLPMGVESCGLFAGKPCSHTAMPSPVGAEEARTDTPSDGKIPARQTHPLSILLESPFPLINNCLTRPGAREVCVLIQVAHVLDRFAQ